MYNKICANRLSMLLIKLPLNNRLFVKFGEVELLVKWILDALAIGALNLALFKGRLYLIVLKSGKEEAKRQFCFILYENKH